MHIRPCRPGEERVLHAVFLSAVHGLASKDYTRQQIEAWAPADLDQDLWSRLIQRIQPFVVVHEKEIVAYADLQPNGYIDHFFVCATHARQGVGSRLMKHLLAEAHARPIAVLSSNVSLTAQPFFEKFGFSITEQRSPVLRGVVIPNALMHKQLTPTHSSDWMSFGHPDSTPHVKR
jgi:putative acetyltransferase